MRALPTMCRRCHAVRLLGTGHPALPSCAASTALPRAIAALIFVLACDGKQGPAAAPHLTQAGSPSTITPTSAEMSSSVSARARQRELCSCRCRCCCCRLPLLLKLLPVAAGRQHLSAAVSGACCVTVRCPLLSMPATQAASGRRVACCGGARKAVRHRRAETRHAIMDVDRRC